MSATGKRARQRLAVRVFRRAMALVGHGFSARQSGLLDLLSHVDELDALLAAVRLGGAPLYFNQLRLPYPNLQALIARIAERDCYGLRAIAAERPVVFDVGAHIGVFARHVLAERPGARVFAFEPDRDNFALLVMNTASWENALCAQQGLLDAPGEFDLHPSSELDWRSSLLLRPEFAAKPDFKPGEFATHYRVPITTIDEVAAAHGIERLDLLKITVPGEIEPRILAGGRTTIARFRPRIALYLYQLNEEAVAATLAELAGYRMAAPEDAERSRIRIFVPARRD